MLTQLLQWLNKVIDQPVDDQQSISFKAARGDTVTESPPDLTNADLEVLFTQLLTGVQQGRGQQWALQYLQRMEDRISTERWIDWLLIFGEKILLSPTPNHDLAIQMVQLGELQIGKVGELSYEIGIRVLTGDLGESADSEESGFATTDFVTVDDEINTPGQDLIRSLGELLWETDDVEFVSTTPQASPESPPEVTPEINSPQDSLTENVEEVIWEFVEPEVEISPEPPLLTPSEEDVIGKLSELSLEYKGQQAEIAKPAPEVIVSSPANWEQSWGNLEPNVAYTLDELLVRLDQSAHLVQQLAANLAVSSSPPPPIITTQESNQAQTWFYQGLQRAKTGDLIGAIAAYDQAIVINPDAPEYWFNKGLTFFHLENFTEAIAAYDQAIVIKPDYYKAWYNRGGTLGELGQFEAAIAAFNRAIQIQPNNPEAISSKALALLKLGQIKEAITSYDQALALEPQDPENWYYRGIALGIDGQNPEAIASYDQAIEIQPDFYEVWIDRGVVLFTLGRWLDAIASWDQALANQPNFYLAWYNRGIALDNLGRRQEAIASYQKALAIQPDFHLAWYNQALALFHLQQFAEAIVAYDNALQIKPDYWEAWIGRGTAAGNLSSHTAFNISTSITEQNPALQQGGYAGKLISYEQGLQHIRPDTHPEGWGRLHLAMGNTHYDQGLQNPSSRYYWCQAVEEYYQALFTLTTEDFPQLHLEVLQYLIKALVGIGQKEPAQELQQRAAHLLTQLINTTNSPDSKKQLALKFAGIGQLAVDLAVDCGDLVEAWEMAEQGKNSCLTWLLSEWRDQVYSPYYNSVQQLLNPQTAIIYWHISPVALHTFIIKDQAPSPILVFTPIQHVGEIAELPLPEAVRRLIDFEDWLQDWQQIYQEYRSQAQDQHSKSNHSWRVNMEQRLLQLHNILEIATIQQELEDITQLILIPHRDLQTLPLHTLFQLPTTSLEVMPSLELNFAITYLPSVQTGLSLKAENRWPWSQQMLLSVEYPNNTNYPPVKSAKLESEIISQMFNNSRRIQESQANKQDIENALSDNYNILHFPGHITNNYHEPEKSALALTGEDKLSLAEISQKTLTSYNLVTLSACELTTTNNQNLTTEYVSLVNAFLHRGVNHIVSTLWTVESSASALVMIEFYRRLQENKSPVIALAEATTWLKELTAMELTNWYENLLNNLHPDELKIRAYLATYLYRTSKMVPHKKLYSHPYYWGAFIITGHNNGSIPILHKHFYPTP